MYTYSVHEAKYEAMALLAPLASRAWLEAWIIKAIEAHDITR